MQERRQRQKRAIFNPKYVGTERRRTNIGLCILFLSIVTFFLFQRYVIAGGIVTERSMLPTLKEGNYYLINKYIYLVSQPQRGDIVVLRPHPYDSDQYIKRVIGLSEETLLISGGKVYINGRPLDEPYAIGDTYPNLGPIQIRKNSYFVMGDNRVESHDSRHFGTVGLKNVEGKIKAGQWFSFR